MNLEWKKADTATGYKLYFGKDNPPSDILNGIDVGDVETYTVEDLEYLTTYYWKVVPYNAAGDAFECPIWSFTTEEEPVPLPNPITTIEAPVNVSNNDYDLNVTVKDFTNVGAVSLILNFDPTVVSYKNVAINPELNGALTNVKDGKFTMGWLSMPDVLEGVTLDDDAILFTINFELLPTAAETTGFVWSKELGECEYASPGGEFIYESTFNDLYWSVPSVGVVPTCAVITNPANGALNVPTTIVLSWNHVDNATGYKLYVGTDNPPTNVENGKDLGYVNDWELVLEHEKKYYWKLVPYNETGDAVNCPVLSFITTGVPPTCSKIIYPTDEQTNLPINLTLQWTAVERAVGYKVYFGIDVDNLNDYIDVGNNTTLTPAPLVYDKVYYWKVVPYNYYGDAENCTINQFSTQEATSENQPPVIKNQKFECKAYKNFNPVGKVLAYDPDPSQSLTWKIVKGDEMDYFYIESCSGNLMYFKDPNLKIEPKNSTGVSADGISAEGDLVKNFTIVVSVTDDHPKNPLSSYAEIFIQVHYPYVFDIDDLDAKKLSDSFQQPIKGTIVTKDGKEIFSKESKEVTFDETLTAIGKEEKGEYKMSVISNDNQRIYIKIQN